MTINKRLLLADLSLLGIAIAWGYTFVLMKDLLDEMTPLYLTGTRFLLAGLIIAAFQYKKLKLITWDYWKVGIACGLALGMAYTLQAFGVNLTTPGKAGVLTGLAVIIVPFLYFFWSKMPVQKAPVIGSIMAFLGLSLLSWNGGGALDALNFGDFLVFLCAVFFAVHVVMVDQTYRNREHFDPILFAMIQLIVVGVLDTILAIIVEPVPAPLSPYGWFAYSFDLFLGTLLAYIVQLRAQQISPPIHVTLILSLESVFAFVFSWLIWGEPVTSWIIAGVVMILMGIYVTELKGLSGGGKRKMPDAAG